MSRAKSTIQRPERAAMEPIQVPCCDAEGNQTGNVVVDPAKLGGRIRRRLMFEAVLRHEACQRRGTHKTKTRSEVAGTGHKMYRQKGSGNARAGTKQAPHRVGGGVSMGPVPRSYRMDMNRKMRRLARASALLSKLVDHEAIVVDSLSFERPATARLAKLIDNALAEQHDRRGRSCLVMATAAEADTGLILSARNLERVSINTYERASAYDLLFHRRLLITRAALEEIVGTLEAVS